LDGERLAAKLAAADGQCVDLAGEQVPSNLGTGMRPDPRTAHAACGTRARKVFIVGPASYARKAAVGAGVEVAHGNFSAANVMASASGCWLAIWRSRLVKCRLQQGHSPALARFFKRVTCPRAAEERRRSFSRASRPSLISSR